MDPYTYFTLTIEGAAGNYTVEAYAPGDVTIEPEPLKFDLTPEMQTEVENIAHGYTPSKSQMQAIGAAMYEAIFPRSIAMAFGQAQRSTPNLRLKFIIRPPELNRLPWEMLYDVDNNYFMAARSSYPLIRYIESKITAIDMPVQGKLRLLYVQALPKGQAALDLTKSEQAVRDNLGQNVEVVSLHHCTPDLLRQHLRQDFHILHYDGHAYFDAQEQFGALVLEDEAGNEHFVSGEVLANMLNKTSIRLLVLAACESGMESPTKRFSGIAPLAMRTNGLPAAIAMQFAVADTSAIAFNKGFYSALAAKLPVEAAVVEARKTILDVVAGDPFAAPDWATPVLFMRTNEGHLFPTKEEKPMSDEKDDQDSGKSVFKFGDNTQIGGDFVVGKKTSVNASNVSASGGGVVNIAGGDIHSTVTQTTGDGQAVTLADFTRLLGEIRAQLDQSGLDADLADEAKETLQKVEDQAAKEKPNKMLLETRLKNVVELVTAAGGAATTLAPLVQKAVEMLSRLF